MPFTILRADLALVRADAIVNAANPEVLIGAGVDAAIHKQAGPRLLAARRRIGRMSPGQVEVTPAFRLHARYVLHAVCPAWQGGGHGEEALLRQCYARALQKAQKLGCRSIAFPLLAAGTLGFPRPTALSAALQAFSEFLTEHEMHITLAVFDKASFALSEALLGQVQSYIDDNYVRTANRFSGSTPPALRRREQSVALWKEVCGLAPSEDACADEDTELLLEKTCITEDEEHSAKEADLFAEETDFSVGAADFSPQKTQTTPPSFTSIHAAPCAPLASAPAAGTADWDRLLQELDAGFSETLLQLIDRSGKTDAEIYKKANIDRKLFSKIRSNPDYRPSKPTVLAFAFALELDLPQTQDLLGRAGFSLSHASRFDVIVECFLRSGNYDLFALNSVLFHYDQPLLGA